jgi:hypothetical protein
MPDRKSCCKADAKPSATAAQPLKFAASFEWEALAPAVLDVSSAATIVEGVSRNAYGDTGPPQLDRVVCLHRLLI